MKGTEDFAKQRDKWHRTNPESHRMIHGSKRISILRLKNKNSPGDMITNHFRAGFLNLGTICILGWNVVLGSCPRHCGMFSSVSGLSTHWMPVTSSSCDNRNCLQTLSDVPRAGVGCTGLEQRASSCTKESRWVSLTGLDLQMVSHAL